MGDCFPVHLNMEILLRSMDPLVWGDIYNGTARYDLFSGDNISMDLCSECMREFVDLDGMKEKWEENQ